MKFTPFRVYPFAATGGNLSGQLSVRIRRPELLATFRYLILEMDKTCTRIVEMDRFRSHR